MVTQMPPMVTDLGYSAIDGTEVLAMISIGGLAGSVAIAILSRFAKLKILMGIALCSSIWKHEIGPESTESKNPGWDVTGVGSFAGIAK